MANTKVLAVVAVLILVVAAVAVFTLNGSDEEEEKYVSDNTDCRLQILGNADENDYLDERDVKKIKEMVDTNADYKQIADANNDSKITIEDAEFVQKILDTKKANQGKEYKDQIKMKVNYISVDKDILSGTFPAGKIIIINSLRSLEIANALDLDDDIVGYSDGVLKYWDYVEYDGLEGRANVGNQKESNLEEIMKLDANTIYAGKATKCCINIENNQIGSKQVIRLATWENGGLENGALMLGFFTDHEKNAEAYVKWLDDLNKDIQQKLDKIPNKKDVKFIVSSSANSLCINAEGTSVALTRTGATNVGNEVVGPTLSYAKAADYKEAIKMAEPQIHIVAPYILSSWTDDQVKEKYDSYDFKPNWEGTLAHQEGNVYMIDYGMPFAITTLVGAHIMFPDQFSKEYLLEEVQEYLQLYTNAADSFQVEYDHLVYQSS